MKLLIFCVKPVQSVIRLPVKTLLRSLIWLLDKRLGALSSRSESKPAP